MRIVTKEYEFAEIGVEDGVDVGLRINNSLLPNLMLPRGGGGLLICLMMWIPPAMWNQPIDGIQAWEA